MLTQRDWELAYQAQDAVNLSGIVFEFAKVMEKLREEATKEGHGTDWKNTHPICIMYADKIHSLTLAFKYENVSQAFEECRKHIKSYLDDISESQAPSLPQDGLE